MNLIHLVSGDYGNAIIRLDLNLLTKFRHEVYLEVLDEMNRFGGGVSGQAVSISGNGIITAETRTTGIQPIVILMKVFRATIANWVGSSETIENC